MIIKALILTTILNSDPAITAMPPIEIVEMRRRNGGKGNKGRKRGGGGLR